VSSNITSINQSKKKPREGDCPTRTVPFTGLFH
jgi:hypothetical protein